VGTPLGQISLILLRGWQ